MARGVLSIFQTAVCRAGAIAGTVAIGMTFPVQPSLASPSLDAQMTCSHKLSEARAAYEADDLAHYGPIADRAEQLCAGFFDDSLIATLWRDRAALLLGARDFDGARAANIRCISLDYNSAFCHLALVDSLKLQNRTLEAKHENQTALKVIDHLIEEHDQSASIFVGNSSQRAVLAKEQRAFLVSLRERALHQLDTSELDKMLASPSHSANESSPSAQRAKQ